MSRRVDTDSLVRGLEPAFRDTRSGETHLALAADGGPSDRHELHHLPDSWVSERDEHGSPLALRTDIVPGYRRGCEFFTLGRQMALPLDS